jgi:hypothetical protein
MNPSPCADVFLEICGAFAPQVDWYLHPPRPCGDSLNPSSEKRRRHNEDQFHASEAWNFDRHLQRLIAAQVLGRLRIKVSAALADGAERGPWT